MKHFMSAAVLSIGIAISAITQPAFASHSRHHPHAAGPRLHVTHPHHVHHVRRARHRVPTHQPIDGAHLLRANLTRARLTPRLSVRLAQPPQMASISLPLPRKSALLPRAFKMSTRMTSVVLASTPSPIRPAAMSIVAADPAIEYSLRPEYRREPAVQPARTITETPDPDEQATNEQATDEQATEEQASDEQASEEQVSNLQVTNQRAFRRQASNQRASDLRALNHEASNQQVLNQQDQPSQLRMVPALFNPPQPVDSQYTEDSEAVTIIYKDGRPSEQIHNFLLSRTTLSVWDRDRDRRYRNIPVEQLDLEATQKANRELGVDFALPNAEQ